MNTIKKFRLKQKYMTSVTEVKDASLYIPSKRETIQGTSYSTIDHPEFTNLRNKLEHDGYIQTERSWINGDKVTHPFILNGMKFNTKESFPCACALGIKFKVAQKLRKK